MTIERARKRIESEMAMFGSDYHRLFREMAGAAEDERLARFATRMSKYGVIYSRDIREQWQVEFGEPL
jgi:hypothetical protein